MVSPVCLWFIDSSQTEKGLTAFLPEQKNRTTLSKCDQQKIIQGPGGNVTMVNDCESHNSSPKCNDKPPSPEADHTAPQNTLYESEMEITVVDSVADIVTVQTKPKEKCTHNQRRTRENKESSSAWIKECVILNYETSDDTTKNTSVRTSCETKSGKSTNTLTSSNEEECLPQWVEPLHEEEDSVTTRRKTHVTSRCTKSNRRLNTQKHFEGHANTQQTYVISPRESSLIAATDGFDDYFRDQAVENQRKSKSFLYDCNVSKDKDTESEAEMLKFQNNNADSRKTYEIQPKSRPQCRKTKPLYFSVDQSVKESMEVNDINADVKEISGHTEKWQSNQPTPTEESNTLRNRGTYVIYKGQISASSDLNHPLDISTSVISGGTEDAVTLDSTHDAECTSEMIKKQKSEQEMSRIPESKNDIYDENLSENSSDLSLIGHKTKVIKERKMHSTKRENAPGRKRYKYYSTQVGDILPKEIQVPGENTKKNSISTNLVQQVTEGLKSSAPKEALMDEPVNETVDINNTHVRHSEHNDSLNLHNIQNHKSRKTSEIKEKENFQVSSSSVKGLIANRESRMAFIANRTFVPHQDSDNQETPGKAEQLRQKHSALFSEDRPPWESLDFGSTESFPCDFSESPVSYQKDSQEIQSQAIDIYEDPGWNVSHQSPGNFIFKNLFVRWGPQ